MLEATPISHLDRLPWSAGGHGLDILDCDGETVLHLNQQYGFARMAWNDRVAAAQQRCAQVAQVVNMHVELCNRLAEMIAMSSAAYRMLDDLHADILLRSDWAVIIERAAAVLEKTKETNH